MRRWSRDVILGEASTGPAGRFEGCLSPSTPADTTTAIVRLLLAAGWALDLQPWLDVQGLRWLAHTNDCGQHSPAQEVEVESELHSEATEAWRELGAQALPHLGAVDAERLWGLLG